MPTSINTTTGITFNDASTQATSITGLFTGSNQSVSGATGYQKFPGGFLLQWGTAAASGTITFPVAFPTACRSVTVTGTQAGSSGREFQVNTLTTTTFIISNNACCVNNSISLAWIAVGN
jgi:hypothetical protein